MKMIMQVMSSMTVSFSFHFWAAARTRAFPAASGECLTKNGHTISATYSFSRNSHIPSLATTINLSSCVSSYFSISIGIIKNRSEAYLVRVSLRWCVLDSHQETYSSQVQDCPHSQARRVRGPNFPHLGPWRSRCVLPLPWFFLSHEGGSVYDHLTTTVSWCPSSENRNTSWRENRHSSPRKLCSNQRG